MDRALVTPRTPPPRSAARPSYRLTAVLLAAILPLGLNAADPQPYDVILAPSGDATLDAAVRDSSNLLVLRDKAPVGGFALVERARQDAARFEAALQAFGYYTLVTREPENPNRQELPTHGANQCDFPGLSREQGI